MILLLAKVAVVAISAAVIWSMGNLHGQIKMGREHLAFLRESSARADAHKQWLMEQIYGSENQEQETNDAERN